MVDDLWCHLCDIFSTILQYGYPIYLAFGVWFKTFIFNKSIIKWWTIYGAISVTFYQPLYSTIIPLFWLLVYGLKLLERLEYFVLYYTVWFDSHEVKASVYQVKYPWFDPGWLQKSFIGFPSWWWWCSWCWCWWCCWR